MEFASRLRPVRLLICWVQMVYILCQVPQETPKLLFYKVFRSFSLWGIPLIPLLKIE